MNLFVARLNSSTTGEDLQEIFSQYGEVASAKIIFDRETGNSKGFGFVEMPNDSEATEAINALNDSELDGKQIVVKQANPRSENRPRRNFSQRRDNFQNRGGNGHQRRDDRRGGGRRNDNRNRGGGGGGYDNDNNWY